MIRYIFFRALMIAAFACTTYFYTDAEAGSVKRLDVDQVFSPAEEAKIQSLSNRSIQEVFKELNDPSIKVKKDLTYKAVEKAFGHRRTEALRYAERYLKEPLIEVVEGQTITRVQDFNVARKIFEVFPDEAAEQLPSLYQKSDGITRGNIIRASGGIDGGPPIDTMLIEALDDRAVAEGEPLEQLGELLRVCDLAYNQLVLKYEIRNVLRTISPGHKIEVRDYHIALLKEQLRAYSQE